MFVMDQYLIVLNKNNALVNHVTAPRTVPSPFLFHCYCYLTHDYVSYKLRISTI